MAEYARRSRRRPAVRATRAAYERRPEVRAIRTARRRLRDTGVTEEQYRAALAAQGGVCAVCGRPDNRTLSADHDHATGRFRGLLCANCNVGLGLLNDDPVRLRAAADYLEGRVKPSA